MCVDLFGHPQPKAKSGQKSKSANDVKTCWNCGESGHMSSQCPKKKVHAVEESTTASQAGSLDTIMVRSVGSYFDVGSVKGNPSTSRSLQVQVSCLHVNIGADTNPLHETRLSMCGGHHIAAGGHELGARILGLEAANVRGDVVNLLVRFRVMNIGKAPLSTQDLSRCGWETVFPADCEKCAPGQESFGQSHHAREETSWYLRTKFKPHNELPYTESEGLPGGDVDGPEGRCAACGRRWKLQQQWSSSS